MVNAYFLKFSPTDKTKNRNDKSDKQPISHFFAINKNICFSVFVVKFEGKSKYSKIYIVVFLAIHTSLSFSTFERKNVFVVKTGKKRKQLRQVNIS